MNTQDERPGAGNNAQLFRYLGSHLVALNVVYDAVDEAGKLQGQEKMFSASGFVIDLDGVWYFVTAGHVLGEGLELPVATGRVQLLRCSLADYFGRNAKNEHPTIIAYETTPKFHVDDWQAGLDIGALQLRPLYVEGLKSNGVEVIPEAHWLEGDATDEQQFLVLGIPDEEKERDDNDPVTEYVRPCVVGVSPCDLPDGQDVPTHPIFVGRLHSNEPRSMVGYSGGPIFRYRQEQSGLRCWLHALQSRWRKSERIVMGCPMTVVARLIRERLGSNQV